MPSADILIVGAGPAGLVLAIELLRRGLKIRIVDQVSKPTDQSRALAIQPRTLELFEKMDVLDEMMRRGLRVKALNVYEKGKRIGGMSLDSLDTPYPFALILPQSETEKILIGRLEALGGKVERPAAILRVDKNVAPCSALCAHADGSRETISAPWIVGCDGAHSIVRQSLNISFQGAKFSEGFGLADVVAKVPLDPRQLHAFLSPQGPFAVIPLPTKDCFRLIAPFPKEFNAKALSAELLQHLAMERAGLNFHIQQIIWTSIFFVHRRIASKMREGTVFLCGDAAHIHSPAGGQGLNISVQDAFDLAWKLSLVHQGKAPQALLDTYEQERIAIAKKILKGTTAATRVLVSKSSLFRSLAFRAASLLLRLPPLRKKFARGLAQLSLHCRSSPLSKQPVKDRFWKGPRPGERAPILEEAQETRFILLVFGAPSFAPKLPADVFAVSHIALNHPEALAYRVKGPALYLIRPDGMVAFRMRRPNEKTLRAYCLRIAKTL